MHALGCKVRLFPTREEEVAEMKKYQADWKRHFRLVDEELAAIKKLEEGKTW